MKTMLELIAAKRDGHEHADGEIEAIVQGYVAGSIPDYQMSAWMMAALLNGLSEDETVRLTSAMAHSGRIVDLSGIPGRKADKHSTGGVGDKTTIVLVPLVSSLGVPIAKMSGRGLGHTGGTIDKLESIPGFRTEMEIEEFVDVVSRAGCAVIGGRADIDPADKKMYALRDVSGTVPSIPLIVGSIISKKIAGGADAIVLDVKVGSGAFMKTEVEARELALALQRTGKALGRQVSCVLTDMDEPLGYAVGNALEVRESIETLSGGGPADLRELCVGLGAKMAVLAEAAPDEAEARARLEKALEDGSALAQFERWIEAQGGDPAVALDPEGVLGAAGHRAIVSAPASGYVAGFDAEGVGKAAMAMGAGRATKDDVVRPENGIVLMVKVGDRVELGEPLAELHADDASQAAEGAKRLLESIRFSEAPPAARPLFREV